MFAINMTTTSASQRKRSKVTP